MGQHLVEVLGHVVLGEYDSVEHQVGGSDSVLEVNIFDLFVKGDPEFPDVTSDENTAAEFRPGFERGMGGQIDHLPMPGPLGVNCVLLPISQLFLFLLLYLFTYNFNSLKCNAPDSLILIKKPREHVGDDSSVVIVFVVDVAGPYFDVFKKLLSDFDVGIVDESCQVVYVVGGFVEIFDGN